MRNIKDIDKYLEKIEKQTIQKLAKVQNEVAQDVRDDVKHFAPGTGEYANTIKVSETEVTGNKIETYVYTDYNVTAKSNGITYNLGYLLENGTLEHAIPNAFNWGVIYGYESDMYKRTLQPDWHPGFGEIPHFELGLNQNKTNYEERIGKVLDEVFK